MFDVLESCERVVAEARHLRIDADAIPRRARTIDSARLRPSEPPEPLRFRGDCDSCANFTLLCDALNFCFWSDAPWIVTYAGRDWTRTFAMMAGVHRAVTHDPRWLAAERWRDAREADVRAMFAGRGEIPLLADRVRVLNETGDRLLAEYGGRFAQLVDQAGGDALGVVERLTRDFPSFKDVADYHGHPVSFLKRAQICAADLAALRSAEGHGTLTGLDRLTVFADYRLPQLFRHWGLLRLGPLLEDRVESLEVVPSGSEAEVEMRAATIVIGDRLAKELGAPAWKVDYFLWEASHRLEVTLQHHRTPTIYY